jgi:hypothetical protein
MNHVLDQHPMTRQYRDGQNFSSISLERCESLEAFAATPEGTRSCTSGSPSCTAHYSTCNSCLYHHHLPSHHRNCLAKRNSVNLNQLHYFHVYQKTSTNLGDCPTTIQLSYMKSRLKLALEIDIVGSTTHFFRIRLQHRPSIMAAKNKKSHTFVVPKRMPKKLATVANPIIAIESLNSRLHQIPKQGVTLSCNGVDGIPNARVRIVLRRRSCILSLGSFLT